jgi:hypothetical protein
MKRLLGCIGAALLTVGAYAQFSNPADDVPAYHKAAPSEAMPGLMKGGQLSGPYFAHPYQVTTYKMAAASEKVLWQEPC